MAASVHQLSTIEILSGKVYYRRIKDRPETRGGAKKRMADETTMKLTSTEKHIKTDRETEKGREEGKRHTIKTELYVKETAQ